LDPEKGKIYWIDGPTLGRANLDGSMIEHRFEADHVERLGLAIDAVNRRLYCTSSLPSVRIPLDPKRDAGWQRPLGTQQQQATPGMQQAEIDREPSVSVRDDVPDLTLIDGILPGEIALDAPNGQVYWTKKWTDLADHLSQDYYEVHIWRAKLDGSGVEDLVYCQGPAEIHGITLDLSPTPATPWYTRARSKWALAGGGLFAILVLALLWRVGARRKQSPTFARTLLKKSRTSVCAVMWGIWIASTFLTAGYKGWNSSLGVSSGELWLSTKKSPLPDHMRGRLASPYVQPGCTWSGYHWNHTLWKEAISYGSWAAWSRLLGLSLPRLENNPAGKQLVAPLWLPVALLTPLTIFLDRRDRRRRPPGHCQSCGYNLTGNTSGICPECGVATGSGSAAAVPLAPSPGTDEQKC
jgi:hypothetical protein